MNNILLIVLLFLMINESASAQPGGGGGVRIVDLLDYHGKPISRTDTNLTIWHYALSNNEKKQKFVIPPRQENAHNFYDKSHTFFYLPPYIQNKRNNTYIPNQRLVLIYFKDTMTIDFIDVLRENGAGRSDVANSIYFKSGYYKSYRNPWDKIDGFGEKKERTEILNALNNGINTSTDYILVGWGLLKHIPDPNLQIKQFERNRNSCKEELVFSPYYKLCGNQITIQDSLIYVQSDSIVSNPNGTNILHFIYYFSFKQFSTDQNYEVQLAAKKLKSFETLDLILNDRSFSGTLKLAIPFHNAGISSKYSGYDLWILEYSQGEMVKLTKKSDVNIITEQPIIRPN